MGVLAIQGDFEAHAKALREVGAEAREVRVPADMEGLDGLIIPGGESTTIARGVEREGLAEPLREFARAGRPVLGTCAGLIMLDRDHLGLLDVSSRRNAFGRQVRSFESQLALDGVGEGPLRAVFIRAPWVEEHGEQVEVLADVDGHPVAVRQGNVLAVAFHPEPLRGGEGSRRPSRTAPMESSSRRKTRRRWLMRCKPSWRTLSGGNAWAVGGVSSTSSGIPWRSAAPTCRRLCASWSTPCRHLPSDSPGSRRRRRLTRRRVCASRPGWSSAGSRNPGRRTNARDRGSRAGRARRSQARNALRSATGP